LELLEAARSNSVKVFTPSGIREYPALGCAHCEGPYITLTKLRYHEGIPCYPLIVECRDGAFKYTVLENLNRVSITPAYSVEGVEGGALVVKRYDGALFKVKDPVLSRVLKYLEKRPRAYFHEVLEDLVASESMASITEYTEDLVETLAIELGIALGFLAYEARLVQLEIQAHS